MDSSQTEFRDRVSLGDGLESSFFHFALLYLPTLRRVQKCGNFFGRWYILRFSTFGEVEEEVVVEEVVVWRGEESKWVRSRGGEELPNKKRARG